MSYKEEKVKLILQYLRQCKHEKTFNSLQNSSQIQLDPQDLNFIKDASSNDDFQQLELLLDQYVDQNIRNKCMLIVLEQRLIKHLKIQDTTGAVILLRTKISKFCQGINLNKQDEEQKHHYASMVFGSEFVLKSEEEIVNQIISLCYKQIGLIEPNRLITLIQQSQANNILECLWHNKYSTNHKCTQQLEYIALGNQSMYQCNLYSSMCVFSSNGEFQALVASDLSIIVSQYNVVKNVYIQYDKLLDTHKGPITQLIFSPCNKYIASSSEDCSIMIYNIHSKKKIRLEGHNTPVQCCSFVQCDQLKKSKKIEYLLYSISIDGWLYEWNESERRGGLKIEEKLLKLHSNQQQEKMLLVSQNKISLYELFTKNQINQTSIAENILNSTTNNSFTQLLILISESYPKLYLYDISTLAVVKAFYGFQQINNQIKFDIGWFNDNLIVGGTRIGNLYVWHIQKSSNPIDMIQVFLSIIQVSEQNTEITCLKFHPKKHLLYIFLASEQFKQGKNQEPIHQQQTQQQQQSQYLSRDLGGVQQILNLLQRIARANPTERRQRMQEEEQESSDEDM